MEARTWPSSLVDSLNATYGVHPGYRAAHAKGVLCAAMFTPSTGAAEFCRADHLAGPVRAHVRFSNGGGDPGVPDGTRDARGMAVKFYRPDGTHDGHRGHLAPGLLRSDAGGSARVQCGSPARSGNRSARSRSRRRLSRRTPRGDGGRERGDHASDTRQLRHAGVPQPSCVRVRSARRHRPLRPLPPRPGTRRSEHHG